MARTNFEKVRDFNITFGLVSNDEEQLNFFDEQPKTVSLRVGLEREELKETEDAYKNNDIVEFIDGLGDCLYVIYGHGDSMGFNLDKYFKDYIKEYYGTDYYEKNNLKDKTNFEVFNTDHKLKNFLITKQEIFVCPQVKLLMDRLRYIFGQIEKNTEEKDIHATITNLVKMLVSIYMICAYINVDIDLAYDLIHESNMSKVCKDEDEAQKTVKWYKKEFEENRQPYDSPDYKKSNNEKYWIVFNKSTGKILKSINYSPVDLSRFDN